jgi:hypothetical protein
MDGSSFMDLVSEFFREFRRVIPSLAVIAFYFDRKAESGLSHHLGATVVGVLIISWLLGLAIDEFMSFVVHCFYVGLGWLDIKQKPSGSGSFACKCRAQVKWFVGVLEPPESEFDKIKRGETPKLFENKEIPESLKIQIARSKTLQFGERQVSRGLCFGFFLTLLWQPESLFGSSWPCYASPLGFVAFGFSWVWPYFRSTWKKENALQGFIALIIFSLVMGLILLLAEMRNFPGECNSRDWQGCHSNEACGPKTALTATNRPLSRSEMTNGVIPFPVHREN